MNQENSSTPEDTMDQIQVSDPEAKLTELEEENNRLREENERLQKLEEERRNMPLKDRLYDHINVSVRTLDIFIGVMVVLLILVVILGRR